MKEETYYISIESMRIASEGIYFHARNQYKWFSEIETSSDPDPYYTIDNLKLTIF